MCPFAAALAKEFSNKGTHFATVHSLMESFTVVVQCVFQVPYNATRATEHARRTCLLYEALEKEQLAAGELCRWRIKPKFHMFVELIEFTAPARGSPSHFWAYADETWGHWLAEAGMRRGGAKFAASVALNLLQRYRAVLKDDL